MEYTEQLFHLKIVKKVLQCKQRYFLFTHLKPIVVAMKVDVTKTLFRARLLKSVLDYTELNEELYLPNIFVKNE